MIGIAEIGALVEKRLVELGFAPSRANINEPVGDAPCTRFQIEIAGVTCHLDVYLARAETPEATSEITQAMAAKVNKQRDVGGAHVTHVQFITGGTVFCDLAAPGAERTVEPQLSDTMRQLWDHKSLGMWLARAQAAAKEKDE